jgi:hypothetical protein
MAWIRMVKSTLSREYDKGDQWDLAKKSDFFVFGAVGIVVCIRL